MIQPLNPRQKKVETPKWSLIPPDQDVGATHQDPLQGWSKRRKLAAFLIMLGRENAATLLREFEDHEVADIVLEMASLDLLNELQQDALRKEFAEVAHMAQNSKRGGTDFAHEVLQMRLGVQKANEIINRIDPKRNPQYSHHTNPDWNPDTLLEALLQESVQTQALVLGYIQPIDAARLLQEFPPHHRIEVVKAIGLMDSFPEEFIEKVLIKLRGKFRVKNKAQFSRSGGLENLAQILNSMESGRREQVLDELQRHHPELGRRMQKMVLVFDDLRYFAPSALVKIVQNLEIKDLAHALVTSSDELRQVVLDALPVRRSRSLGEMLNLIPSLHPQEVKSAQAKILHYAEELLAQGEIKLTR